MSRMSTKISPFAVRTTSKVWSLIVLGYSIEFVALVAFLTINGASGIPTAATIATVILIVAGLLLPASGMLLLRRSIDPAKKAARNGLALQGFGLIGLLIGVVIAYTASALTGFFVSLLFIIMSGASALAGVIFMRRHYVSIGVSNVRNIRWLVLGTVLIFSGVGLIAGSNIAFEYYVLSQVENTVFVDIGATVTAWGCVLAAYSFFVLHNRR
jgi:hypothetical protein